MHGINDLTICHCLRVPGVRWKPPSLSCYKLNVDGSVEGSQIYASCVVRNSLGFLDAAFSITLGRGIALDAEVLAGMHGMVFPHARGWNNLWVESDNNLAVKILTSSGKNIPW